MNDAKNFAKRYAHLLGCKIQYRTSDSKNWTGILQDINSKFLLIKWFDGRTHLVTYGDLLQAQIETGSVMGQEIPLG